MGARDLKNTLYELVSRIGKAVSSPKRLELLRQHGYQVQKISDGVPEWLAAGLPLET